MHVSRPMWIGHASANLWRLSGMSEESCLPVACWVKYSFIDTARIVCGKRLCNDWVSVRPSVYLSLRSIAAATCSCMEGVYQRAGSVICSDPRYKVDTADLLITLFADSFLALTSTSDAPNRCHCICSNFCKRVHAYGA